MDTAKLTDVEIIAYLTTNLTPRKRVMWHNIDAILRVNAAMSEDDIATLRYNSQFYDDMHDIHTPFVDVMDNAYMDCIDVEGNCNDVMLWLHSIYT